MFPFTSPADVQVRFVGLSTALANPRDLSDWLGVKDTGLYNFRPSVRPIPCEVHIQVCFMCFMESRAHSYNTASTYKAWTNMLDGYLVYDYGRAEALSCTYAAWVSATQIDGLFQCGTFVLCMSTHLSLISTHVMRTFSLI